MPDFKGAENFHLILAFIVPGLIIVYVRSRFIAGRTPSQSEQILSFLVLSLVYYTLTIPLLEAALDQSGSWSLRAVRWVGLTLVGPSILGLMLGLNAQKGWTGWAFIKVGLYLVDIIPTAWDWRFSKIQKGGMFILVTLNDDSQVAGFFGSNSFASSDKDERDLYIEEEYVLTDDGAWAARSAKVGILISAAQIKHVEFFER